MVNDPLASTLGGVFSATPQVNKTGKRVFLQERLHGRASKISLVIWDNALNANTLGSQRVCARLLICSLCNSNGDGCDETFTRNFTNEDEGAQNYNSTFY